jgi:hypothetical protein
MVVFFYLAYAHFRISRTSLRTFRLRKSAIDEGSEEIVRTTAAIDKFVDDFNKYLDILSGNMRTQNLIAAGTYFLAGLASLVSWILSFIPL